MKKNKVRINIKNLQKKIPINALASEKIKKAIIGACFFEEVKKPGEVTVCLVDNRTIRELNLCYLADYRATDVMAFDFDLDGRIVADIVISTDTAVSNARRFKTTPSYELFLYAVHGMLHILGYDDDTSSKRKLMDKKASEILEKICLYKKRTPWS
jgi:probable rRNA maturation factor